MGIYKDEFLRHWQDVSNSVESSIIMQIRQTGVVSVEILNDIIERETSAWKNTFESKGKFIVKLSEVDAEAANKFKDLILNFKLSPVAAPKKSSGVPSLAVGAIVGAGAFALAKFAFHTSNLISTISGAVGLLLVSAAIGSGKKDKYLESAKETYGVYNNQLEAQRNKLLDIISKMN